MAIFGRTRPDLPQTPERWSQALEAALRVSELASSAMALPDAIQAMVRSAIELLSGEQGSIMLLEEDGRSLVLVASVGLPTEATLGQHLAVGESIAGRVLATGKPLLLGEVDKDAFVNFIPKSRPIASSVVVPLRAQGRAIGVLNLAMGQGSPEFTDEDLRVAQMFADQAAGLIFRARLHERAEQRSSDLMALVDSSRGLLGTLDVEVLLQHIIDGGARLAGSKEGFACLFDRETGSITRGVYRGMDKRAIGTLVNDPEVRKAVETSDIAILENDELGVVTAVGLRTGQGTKGVIVVSADPQMVRERSDLLRAFGQQCALALGTAELHAQIQRKESELGSIIQGVPNPIVLVDAHRKIVAINPAAEQVFNLSTAFSAGAPVTGTLRHPELEQLLSGDGELQSEVMAGSPPRTFKVRVTNVSVPGAPMGRVMIMDDVTTEREMVQTQRDFVAMIGHELRTPLTIVKGFAKTLLRRIDTAGKDEAREALTTIDARASQLERLIEDLLYVSQIEAREASLRVENCDVGVLVRTVADDVIQQHPEREIALDVPGDLQWPCDETKVALVLRHLIENALKYSDDGNPVRVRVSSEGDELRLDVIDKGRGIVSSDLPHVFDRFRQIDSTSTREHGGTGVGLYLCAQLVRVHGGKIWVDSTWGKGSTFSFSLPKRSTGNEVVTIHARREEAG